MPHSGKGIAYRGSFNSNYASQNRLFLGILPSDSRFFSILVAEIGCFGGKYGYTNGNSQSGGKKALYSVVTSFLELLGSSEDQIRDFSQEETRTAIAVLYYRVILVDGRIRLSELDHYRSILSETLDVTEDELLLFEDKVLDLVKSEKALEPFAEIVRKLPIEKRREILLHMEQISISDKELHEFEINLVSKTAELLDMSPDWRSQLAEVKPS